MESSSMFGLALGGVGSGSGFFVFKKPHGWVVPTYQSLAKLRIRHCNVSPDLPGVSVARLTGCYIYSVARRTGCYIWVKTLWDGWKANVFRD